MNMKRTIKACAGFAMWGAFLLSGNAYATLQLGTGIVDGNQGTENVLLTNTLGSGNLVTGELNQSGSIVNFTSNENITVAGGGQSRIVAVDGAFNFIQWSLADPTLGFSKVIFDIDAAVDGFADIFLLDQFGTTFSFLHQALAATGNNYFTGYSNDNQVIVKATINSSAALTALSDLQQVRLGPTDITVGRVPEPATLALLALGLFGIAAVRRRRQ